MAQTINYYQKVIVKYFEKVIYFVCVGVSVCVTSYMYNNK